MAKKDANKTEVTLTVTRTNFYLGKQTAVKENVEKIQVRAFATEPARVNIALSRKLNMGNYESYGIDIGLSVPCYLEEIKEVVPQAIQYVELLLADAVHKGGGKPVEVDLNEL